jgi:hypothetical protein
MNERASKRRRFIRAARLLLSWSQLFLASYALLFALLALKFSDANLSMTCAAITILGVMSTGRILGVLGERATSEIQLGQVSDKGGDVGAYILTYILPFLTVAEPSAREIAAYALFICVVAIVYIRSNLIFINPLLYLFGYRIFGITTGEGSDGFLVARHQPKPGPIDGRPRRCRSV